MLEQIDGWPAEISAAGVVSGERRWVRGPTGREFGWASVTKLFTATATLIAAEEGIVDLDEPAGPEGSTVRHLLAHASGLPFEGKQPIARPAQRRIYSNTGFEVLGDRTKCEPSEDQLSGLGFSSTVRNSVVAKVTMTGGRRRLLSVQF